jgi:hypothetical protein
MKGAGHVTCYIVILYPCNMNQEIRDMIELIDEQITLSDTGENTMSLNTLYYELYVEVSRLIK